MATPPSVCVGMCALTGVSRLLNALNVNVNEYILMPMRKKNLKLKHESSVFPEQGSVIVGRILKNQQRLNSLAI